MSRSQGKRSLGFPRQIAIPLLGHRSDVKVWDSGARSVDTARDGEQFAVIDFFKSLLLACFAACFGAICCCVEGKRCAAHCNRPLMALAKFAHRAWSDYVEHGCDSVKVIGGWYTQMQARFG
jgi:hypothetical protein